MARILFLFVLTTLPYWSYSDTKNIICELEGNYSITYEDFRRNYFNEAVEIAKNVAVTTTQSLFFLNRAKQSVNKDVWDNNQIEVTQYWAISESTDELLKLDYVIEPAPVWITSSEWKKEDKETGILITHFLENDSIHPTYPEYKVDVYQISNEFNWFTGKARVKGDIWLKRIDGTKGRDPKIEILAKGTCENRKRKF